MPSPASLNRRPVRLQTPEFYKQLVAAFLEHGQHYRAVAKACGCDQRTSKKAWEVGWLHIGPWARPIKEVYFEHVGAAAKEMGVAVDVTEVPSNPAPPDRASAPEASKPDGDAPQQAIPPGLGTAVAKDALRYAQDPTAPPPRRVGRPHEPKDEPEPDTGPPVVPPIPVPAELVRTTSDAEIARRVDAAIARVREEVAAALVREGELIKVARNNVLGVFVLSDQALAHMRPLMAQMQERIAMQALDMKTSPMTTLRLLERLTRIMASAVTTGAKVMEMQRLLVGMPQSITESRTVEKPTPTATGDEARRKLAETLAMMQRLNVPAPVDEYEGEEGAPETESDAST